MTDDERYEITVLAEALETARSRYECMKLSNTPTDPDERVRSSIAYHLAQTEYLEAQATLFKVQQRIAWK